ncbi:head-tail connector protein [Variovorax sp. tm]|uniref:head-tail connector protein n=1 Tax=Variovorax atrisoli TaxID=3394203 RepID=UPI003A80D342
MSIIALTTAKAHLRLESDYPDDQVQGKLDAAESSAAQFLNRRIFEDQDALNAAVAAVPAALVAAGVAYQNAMTAAGEVEDSVARCAAEGYALRVYRAAQTSADETYTGIVMNPQIEAAILLTLGHLFENRQDVQQGAVQQLPIGATQLLFPFRVGLGV